jgi:predicted enzyme related to lactoylglutathione lyase
MRLEAVLLPVSDVARTKSYYEMLGWQVDVDHSTADLRVVQITPPGSACAIIFGVGITAATPGSVRGLFLTVTDIEAARAELTARGAEVSEIFHDSGATVAHVDPHHHSPGLDPERRSYASYASFIDPDGNEWQLREIAPSSVRPRATFPT